MPFLGPLRGAYPLPLRAHMDDDGLVGDLLLEYELFL